MLIAWSRAERPAVIGCASDSPTQRIAKHDKRRKDQPMSGQTDRDTVNVPRRDFISASAIAAAAAAGTAMLATSEVAAQAKSAEEKTTPRRKTFLAIEGHMDDAEIGCGGLLIQAARAGHRVVIVTVASDYTTWAPTVGREDRTKLELLELAKKFGFEKR